MWAYLTGDSVKSKKNEKSNMRTVETINNRELQKGILVIQVNGKPITGTISNLDGILQNGTYLYIVSDKSKYTDRDLGFGYMAVIPEENYSAGALACMAKFAQNGLRNKIVIYSKDVQILTEATTFLSYLTGNAQVLGVPLVDGILPALTGLLEPTNKVRSYLLMESKKGGSSLINKGPTILYEMWAQSVYRMRLLKDENGARILEINSTKQPDLSKQYRISSMIIYKNELLQPHIGLISDWNSDVQRHGLSEYIIGLSDKRPYFTP
jgi:hypothetical protein